MPRARRFIADEHLLRLARWLRAAGEDVLSPWEPAGPRRSPDGATAGGAAAGQAPAGDRRLIEVARAEDRVILTRDRRLALEAGPAHAHRIGAEHLRPQLLEFFRAFPADPLARAFTRCLLCNAPLAAIGRAEAAGAVPPDALARHDEFRRCPSCRRVYWAGGHYRRLRSGLESLAREAPAPPRPPPP